MRAETHHFGGDKSDRPENSPPPPPPNENSEERPPAKKVWAKPTLRRIENGVVVTEAGANVSPGTPEGPTYRPNS